MSCYFLILTNSHDRDGDLLFRTMEVAVPEYSAIMHRKVLFLFFFSISRLLCLAFLYGWGFLIKISLDWLLTLTTQLSTLKLSENP